MKVLFFLIVTVMTLHLISPSQSKSSLILQPYFANNQSVAKIKAFGILKTKCNVCHAKQNRRKVFTLDNMDAFAEKIHKQVFVKKRMPKGKKITLTESDYTTLKNWLKSLNIK